MSIQPLDFTVVSKAAPPIPSKWDVIPVHGSDRGTFKFCRRQWAWSSPSKYNLIPRAAVHGIREPLWFGTGFHHALERYYAPHLQEDPVVTWQAWFDLQWNGGLVHINDIKEFIDREPIQIDDTTFKVKGLDELLPFPDPERFAELRDLGTGMAQFYKSYAEKNDAFNVIETEHDFSVPIFTPDGDVFYAEDTRETPDDWEPNFELENEFGPLMKYGTSGIWKQVHARGRQDLIIQDSEVGQFGMFDHKTTSRTDDDYFRGLDLDEQCTTYLAIGELEARMYGLEYEELDFIIYQAILKGYPKPPTITSRGMPSINRQEETTTAEMFEATIKGMGLTAIFEADPKLQNYYTWLLEKGDERFIVRTPVLRNKHQKRNALLRLYYEAVDMLSNPRLYPNPTRNYGCLNCVFRGPCIMREAGDDWEATLADGYVQNWDR
jgi:hypothetical protein